MNARRPRGEAAAGSGERYTVRNDSARNLPRDIRREPAELGARRIALELLAHVREARDRLDDPADKSALHDFRVALRRLRSWLRAFRPQLRDTVDAKVERQLERVARATGTSRDLEVHIDWVKHARRRIGERGRPGADWLIRRLRADKRQADADVRENLDRYFTKAVRRAERALECYVARVADDGPRFGETAADLVAGLASALISAVQGVRGQGDRAEAHAARIAAKRLRYVIEPLAAAGVAAGSTVDELKQLQDTLGELHDAQEFGSELATMISQLGARAATQRSETKPAEHRTTRTARPVTGLRTMLLQLRRAEAKAFRNFDHTWRTADWSDEFGAQLSALEASLR